MIELEKTFLAKTLPEGVINSPSKEIIDVYFPATSEHPTLRLRKNGSQYELTKKQPVADDASEQNEFTIPLTEDEFSHLNSLAGKRVRKIRYNYSHQGRIIEFDVFQDRLLGLILIDVEFQSVEEKQGFVMPEFCLVDVTHEVFIAGGMLCGKRYEDITASLEKYSYRRIET